MTAKQSRGFPTSRAKTAYGLLSDIAKLALQEPKRMAMAEWMMDERRDSAPDRGFPKCGSVGCIGGWTEALRPRNRADQTLGLSIAQEDELFYDPKLTCADHQQTVAHAKAVARHIAKFQRKYAKQLKAKRV